MKRHTYTLMDELMASPTEPMPQAFRTHQLTRMWGGLRGMERADSPTTDDWRVCSDAVNLLETLVDQKILADDSGLLADAIEALAHAGRRHKKGQPIRLDAAGIQAVRAVLEDYAEAVNSLPARVMIRDHRATEKRIRDILQGKKRPHDVEVMDL